VRERSGGLLLVCLWGGAPSLWGQCSQPVRYEDAPEAVCDVRDERITEASGVVTSRRNPGCYYVHNDSGDAARVFLVDRQGRTRLTVNLTHAHAVDYEDIALAPGKLPGTFDVCVADIGDNQQNHTDVVIYRFPEVELKEGGGKAIEVEPTVFRLRYADGPADAEAFCVQPRTGDGYILTKRTDGRSFVYKLPAPWDASRETVLEKCLTLELPPGIPLARVVTAADISSDGCRVAVRCYVQGWEWRLPTDGAERNWERVFQTKPVSLPLAAEPVGEGLCYAADGRAILTISEGKRPTLYELRVRPQKAP